jgi:hypothetical protein
MIERRPALPFVFALFLIRTSCCQGQELFEAPPRGTPDIPLPPVSDSVLTLTARIPYSILKRATETSIPASFALSGTGHVGCAKVPYIDGFHIGTHEQCADYNWHATVNADGPFQLARSGDAIHLEQPLRIDGQAGVGGDLAGLLSLSAKNFEARLTPGADLRFSMSDQWCPVVSVTPTRNWVSSAVVEAVGKNCIGIDLGPLGHPEVCAGPANVDLTSQLNGELNSRQGDISRAAQDALPCDKVRERIAAPWHSYSIPVSFQDAGPPLFLNVLPTRAGLSSFRPEEDAVVLTARVSAQTRLAPAAAAVTPLALPPLQHIEGSRSLLEVKAQAELPFALLLAELTKALKGKDFEKATALGRVHVHVEEVDLYPSQSKVAFGMRITAKIPGRILNTSGWVYAIGKPTVSDTGKALIFTELSYATVVDSFFWNAAAELFKHTIMQALQNNATIDLTKLLQDHAQQFAERLNQTQMPGLAIKTDTATITVKSIDVASQNLIVNLDLAAPFQISLTEALLTP